MKTITTTTKKTKENNNKEVDGESNIVRGVVAPNRPVPPLRKKRSKKLEDNNKKPSTRKMKEQTVHEPEPMNVMGVENQSKNPEQVRNSVELRKMQAQLQRKSVFDSNAEEEDEDDNEEHELDEIQSKNSPTTRTSVYKPLPKELRKYFEPGIENGEE